MKPDKKEKRLALPFFTALAVLTVVAFLIPLRPTESASEKRKLAAFPAFSEEALLEGSYFDDISAWFSDTFPGREGWLTAAAQIDALHGLQDSVVRLDSLKNPEPTDDLDALLAETPAPTAPPAETAQQPAPSAVPTPTPEPTPSPEPTPEPPGDPTETVDSWDGFDADDELTMYGGSVLINGTVFASLSFSQRASDNHTTILNYAAQYFEEKDLNFYYVPVPTSVGILVSPELLGEIGSADQGKIISYLFQKESDSIIKVNVFNDLIAHNDEYLYFHSDHHWTALGAYYGYVAFCRSAGLVPVPLSEYTEKNMGVFAGSFYSTMGQSQGIAQDEVIAYIPPGNVTMDILGSDDSRNGSWGPVVDKSASENNMKYIAFINGDNPVTVLTNNDLPDAPSCVVIKDSYGNPFVVYLTQHYHQVIVLDYRKVSEPASYYAELYGAQDVILCQSVGVTQTFGPQTLLPHLLK